MTKGGWLYRTGRLARRIAIGVATLILVVAVVGYLFLMGHVDPHSAWDYAAREIDSGALHYGERPIRIAHVYRRRASSYFRAANGLLVATPDRVLFIGIEPRDNLAGADAPATILSSEFPLDTLLSVTTQRVYVFTADGIALQRGPKSEAYAAAKGYDAELDSLADYVDLRQRQQRGIAARDADLRAQLADLLKQPLYYVVEPGDAISTIAARFRATDDDIRTWNKLPNDRVRVGEKLLVRPAR
jgi:hypothetical protein